MSGTLCNGYHRGIPAARGLTLLELLLVIALVGILMVTVHWGSGQLIRGRQLQRAGEQLHEDLKSAQATAEMAGGLTLGNGTLVSRRIFLTFDMATSAYAAHQWRDRNGNGVPEAGESQRLWHKSLPPGVTFGWAAGIDRRACSNANNPPGSSISFARPDYPPCNDQPCIKFDQHGFSEMGPGAIYLVDGDRSLAITVTRPGHVTLCAWNGTRWQ